MYTFARYFTKNAIQVLNVSVAHPGRRLNDKLMTPLIVSPHTANCDPISVANWCVSHQRVRRLYRRNGFSTPVMYASYRRLLAALSRVDRSTTHSNNLRKSTSSSLPHMRSMTSYNVSPVQGSTICSRDGFQKRRTVSRPLDTCCNEHANNKSVCTTFAVSSFFFVASSFVAFASSSDFFAASAAFVFASSSAFFAARASSSIPLPTTQGLTPHFYLR